MAMDKAPCESVVWKILPCLRSALAHRLKQMGMRQIKVAELLGVSTAAVSQYLARKRGCSDEVEETLVGELDRSAAAVADGTPVTRELCRLCRIIRQRREDIEVSC